MRVVSTQSSQIGAIAYAVDDQELYVKFRDGSWYRYDGVDPRTVAYILFDPESQGKAFNRYVKAAPEAYPATKVDPSELTLHV